MSRDDELRESVKRGLNKVAQRFVADAAGDLIDSKAVNKALDDIDTVDYGFPFSTLDQRNVSYFGDVSGKEIAKAYPSHYQSAGTPDDIAEGLAKQYTRDTTTGDRQMRKVLKSLGLNEVTAKNTGSVAPNVFGPEDVSMFRMSETVPTTNPRPNQ